MNTANVKRLLLLLFSAPFCISCASLLNRGTQTISVTTDKKIKILSVDSSLKMPGTVHSFYVVRNKTPLAIHVQVDSANKTVLIKSKNSLAFWANIYFNYGVGVLVDMNNPKRFTYPKHIYLNYKDNDVVVKRFSSIPKGTIYWHLGFPYANFFYVKTTDSYRHSSGFLGIESGLDYYYKENHFLSFYLGAAMDFLAPFPAPIDVWGEYQTSATLFVSARNNYNIGSFNLGYGLSFSKLTWLKSNDINATFISDTKHTSSLGLSLISSYKVGKYFQLGLLYQPYLLDVGNKINTDYQHHISLDLMVKIPTQKRRR